MSDGDIDYSTSTLLELEEALAGINRQRYPKNYANLRSAYEQRTGAVPPPPAPTATATDSAVDQEPIANLWGRFWGSRFVALMAGAGCFWWAYDLLSPTDACPSGGKLIGDLVKIICERFGHTTAAGIPFLIGVALVVLAMRPGQRTEV